MGKEKDDEHDTPRRKRSSMGRTMGDEPEIDIRNNTNQDKGITPEKDSAQKSDDDETKKRKGESGIDGYENKKRSTKSINPYRVGPLDIDEINNTETELIATIDSDCENLDIEKMRKDLKISRRRSLKSVMGELMTMGVGVAAAEVCVY